MLEFHYGTVNAGKTRISKEIYTNYVFIDASECEDVVACATCFTSNGDDVLITNVHLLNIDEVNAIRYLVDRYSVDIITSGLKTDPNTNLFEGSKRLLEIADIIEEMPSTCECGKKALFNIQVSTTGDPIIAGAGFDKKAQYKAVCSSCYKKLTEEALENNKYNMMRELQDECGI